MMLFQFVCFGIRYENYEFCVCVWHHLALVRLKKLWLKAWSVEKDTDTLGLCLPPCTFSVWLQCGLYDSCLWIFMLVHSRVKDLLCSKQGFSTTFLRNSLKIIFLVGFLSVGESWSITPTNYSLVKWSRVNKNFQYLKKNLWPWKLVRYFFIFDCIA